MIMDDIRYFIKWDLTVEIMKLMCGIPIVYLNVVENGIIRKELIN